METARDRPRALKEPVGLPASSLIEEAREPDRRAQAPRGQERREALAQADAVVGVVDGQHVVVAPQRGLAQREVAGAHVLGRALEVVAREQRAPPHSQRFRICPGG